MAGGVVAGGHGARANQYNSKLTFQAFIVCIVAASGGLLFGYDLGITGGVSSLDPFLQKFFPSVYNHKQNVGDGTNPYCQYDNQILQLWTSTMFITGAIAGIVANFVTARFGRRVVMIIGGGSFLLGTGLLAGAAHISMLFIGRVCWGVGVGFANQAVPLYLSEMAPAHMRGGLNITFQLATTIGILGAQCINYGTSFILPWGWRLSLALAGVPSGFLFLGGMFLPDTPNSLVHRGHDDQGRKVLERIRGTKDVDAEFADIKDAVALANSIAHPFRNLLRRKHRPLLVAAILIPLFQQFTGINAVMFYAPQLFNSLGSGKSASLLSAVIIGAINCASTTAAIVLVDRIGRKWLFLEGGIQMAVAEIATAIVMVTTWNSNSVKQSSGAAAAVLVLVCIFVSAFAWSWGPLGWLVPSEMHSLETRSAGQSITVCVNFLATFIIGQSYLTMLCSLRWGVYIFFAAFVVVMTLYVHFFLIETKGVPLEEMYLAWGRHWFWKRIVGPNPLPPGTMDRSPMDTPPRDKTSMETSIPTPVKDAAVA